MEIVQIELITCFIDGTMIKTRWKANLEDKRKVWNVPLTDPDVGLFRINVTLENIPKLDDEGGQADQVGQ